MVGDRKGGKKGLSRGREWREREILILILY